MAVVDPFDGPEIATLAVAVLSLVGVLVNTFVSNRARQHTRVVRSQVENEHQDAPNPNLREDLDAKERAAEERDRRQAQKLDKVLADIAGVKQDVGLLKEGWRTNRDDIDDLMDTENRRREAAAWGPPQPQPRVLSRRERRNRNA
jgi:hypothetical protein